ncbi:MAG: hypothetical protein EPN53_16735 [Acidobacteria bacterium]|nr:MAG: hypothetical protein EPN53_16735 [Acidobacteriota bacterium]
MTSKQAIIGQQLTLYDGSKVQVTAAPGFALGDDLFLRLTTWLRGLVQAADGELNLTTLGPWLAGPLPRLQDVLLFVLRTSNPDREIDVEWCRAHVFAPDVYAILRAWIQENRLEGLVADLKRRALAIFEGAADVATTAARRPAPDPPGGVQ